MWKPWEDLGLEFEIKDDFYLGVAHYTNSFYDDSNLIYVSSEYSLSKHLYFGPIFGIADGYASSPGKSDYLMIGGATFRLGIVRLTVTPVVAIVGLVIDWDTH